MCFTTKHNIISLPDELHLHILSYLPISSLLVYQQTCTQCNIISQDSILWRGKFTTIRPSSSTSLFPSPRLCASCVVYEDDILLFGGDAGQKTDAYTNDINDVKNDFWRFNMRDGKWSKSSPEK